MNILILHDKIAKAASPDSIDNIVVTAFAERYLRAKHQVTAMEFDSDIEKDIAQIKAAKPHLVFNLVESLSESGALSVVAVQLLEYLGIPYTGCAVYPQMVTADKQLLKKVLIQNELPTPGIVFTPNEKYIIKARMEHASAGLDNTSVKSFSSLQALSKALNFKTQQTGMSQMFEQYIEGREFGCAFLGNELLPAVEYVFDNQYKGNKIITYAAKWNEETVQYKHHRKSFELDAKLSQRIEELTYTTCKRLMLNGYGRIDFRMDRQENLYIIDINTNPCISPDSTFMAMIEQKQWSVETMFDKIIEDALL